MKFLQRSILIFVISLCGSLSAQTTVCSGDSVVLVLNGYKQGSIQWQQSSDQTIWSNASGNNDSLVVIANTTNYYRAILTDGTCSPFYSDTVQIVVYHPISPTAKPASDVTLISFTANWNIVAGATTYYLDVATDNAFTSFVSGYQNLQVNNRQTTYTVVGLQCNRTYYYRVRVHDDNCDTTSGNSNTIAVTTPACPVLCTYKSTCNGDITDTRDGKITHYKTVQIGTQCWMAQNLNVGTMIQGILPQTSGADNQDSSIQKYCYDDNPNNCNTYGGLYLWTEMMAYGLSDSITPGPKGICPTAWHLPVDSEWKCLEMNLGMTEAKANTSGFRGTIEGNKLKMKGNGDPPLWASPSAGTDISSFSALPGGFRTITRNPLSPSFLDQGIHAFIWTATEYNGTSAWLRCLASSLPYVFRDFHILDVIDQARDTDADKTLYGFSVRCVKDF